MIQFSLLYIYVVNILADRLSSVNALVYAHLRMGSTSVLTPSCFLF